MENQLSRCQYVILPARPEFDFKHRELTNSAYDFWKGYWQRIFRQKAPDFWHPHDFFRQNLAYCLFYDGVLVAQNLSTFADVNDRITEDLPYFESFKGEPAKLMKEEGVRRIMTLEYTAVHPGYGERRTGIRFAEVMNGLALNVFRELNFDATTGTPRRLSGLSEVTANYGYRKISENYKKAGWELDVYVGFKGELKEHPDPAYRKIIQELWNQRVDYSNLTSNLKSQIQFSTFTQRESNMTSTNIRSLYQESMNHLADKFDTFDWTDKELYAKWLSQAYYLVRHTTRLLALCAGHTPFEYEETHKRVMAHLREEDGHDVIAVADLKALGVDMALLPELPETTALIQLQYQDMAQYSGCAFFGYILLLEGLAVTRGGKIHDIVSDKYGPRVTRFLKTHAEDDIEHIERAFEQIESFSPKDQIIVAENLKKSARLYSKMLDRVLEHTNSKASPAWQAGATQQPQYVGVTSPQ